MSIKGEPSETELRLKEALLENASLRQHGEDADRLIRALGKRLVQAERDRASLSWRLTQPVRWLQARIRGHRADTRPPVALLPLPQSPRQPVDILFLIGCQEGESKRYRVNNLVQGLQELGWSTRTLDAGDGWRAMVDGTRPKVVVFFRTHQGLDADHRPLLDYLKATGTLTVFDIDDYVFEPRAINGIAAIAAMLPEQRLSYEKEIAGYRAMMMQCDRATASTAYLADRIRELGVPAYHVTNSVNLGQRARARAVISTLPRGTSERVRIGYFSGSRTHMRDFTACEAAVMAVLRDHPNVVLRIVGYLDLGPQWTTMLHRVEQLPFVHHLDTLDLLRECDINLACLEEGVPFCEAKSELKFFESALVETPTIASRTPPYEAAIQDGANGYLASSIDEWRTKLDALVRSPALRENLGRAARETALNLFTTRQAVEQALEAYGLQAQVVVASPALPRY